MAQNPPLIPGRPAAGELTGTATVKHCVHLRSGEAAWLTLKQFTADLQVRIDAGPVPDSFEFGPDPVTLIATRRLVIPRDATEIRLQLKLPNVANYSRYRAVVTTVDGQREVARQDSQPMDGGVLATFAPNVLPPDDYILTVQGMSADGKWADVETYSFGISRY